MQRFTSRDFDAERGNWVACASDLALPPGKMLKAFEMEAAGQIARFEMTEQVQDREGDVMYWLYESEHLPGRTGKMTAIVFND